jgi:hypothetical protein
VDVAAGVASSDKQGNTYQNAQTTTIPQTKKHRLKETGETELTKHFEEATKLIHSGKMNPSRYALQKWYKEKNNETLGDSTVRAWQEKWLKHDFIEQYQLANGKQSYRLKTSSSLPVFNNLT